MNILMWCEDFDGKIPAPIIYKPRPIWTGKQVINLIIPNKINLIRYYAWHSEFESGVITPEVTVVRIEKGEFILGTLYKKTIGTSSGRLIHVIWYTFVFNFIFGFLCCAFFHIGLHLHCKDIRSV